MTHLIERESWSEPGGARTIGYFCGVIDDREDESPEATVERAGGDAVEFIERDLGTLWPGAVRGGAFDWDVLIDPEGRSGPGALRGAVLARERGRLGALRAHPGRLGRAPAAVGRLGLREPVPGRGLDEQRHRRRLRGGRGDLGHGRRPRAQRRRACRSPERAPAGSGPTARSCRPTWSSAAAPPRPRPSPARAAASPDCCSRATASASTRWWSACSTSPPAARSSTARSARRCCCSWGASTA